jgi:hypothetical protein
MQIEDTGLRDKKEKLRGQKKRPSWTPTFEASWVCMTRVNTPFSRNSKRRAIIVVSSNHLLLQTVSSPKADFQEKDQ